MANRARHRAQLRKPMPLSLTASASRKFFLYGELGRQTGFVQSYHITPHFTVLLGKREKGGICISPIQPVAVCAEYQRPCLVCTPPTPPCFGNLEAKYLHFSTVPVNSLENVHLSTLTTPFSLSHSFGRLLSSSSRLSWPLFQTGRWACVI